MSPANAYNELLKRAREANLLASCGSLLGWDERTGLPPKGAAFRAEQMGLLARLGHEMATHRAIGDLLLEVEPTLVPAAETAEAANVREIRRGYDRAVKLPAALVEELAQTGTRAQGIWEVARRDNDFAAFQPWLEKILKLKREEAQAIGYRDHPYDALLDEYEPGASAKAIRSIFADLVRDLTPLLKQILEKQGPAKTDILHRDFPAELQKQFGEAAAKAIGFDFEAGRLDATTHPFCSGIGPGDCRITTRYNPKFFNESFFGILHEAGHGIYEQNLPAAHFGTPLGSYCSLGIHESQSRLWENQVGRGLPFWKHWFPRAQALFPSLRSGNLEEFHRAVNAVQPSFIRVEADEATYNLHIVLRFELEMDLISGDLSVADLPGAWNDKFRKSFGLTPPDDRAGCLQDIHWSMGGLGYFPTYTLGNLYAAQFMERAKKDIPDLEGGFERGEFLPLKDWLVDNIHSQGRRYTADQLCRRITGKALTHGAFITYLKDKYQIR